jgi:class 3 adenylate cyclase
VQRLLLKLQIVASVGLLLLSLGGTAYWFTGRHELPARISVTALLDTGVSAKEAKTAVSRASVSGMTAGILQFAIRRTEMARDSANAIVMFERWSLRVLALAAAVAGVFAFAATKRAKLSGAARSLALGLAALAYCCMWILVFAQDKDRALYFVVHGGTRLAADLLHAVCWGTVLAMAVRFTQRYPREISPVDFWHALPAWTKREGITVRHGKPAFRDWARLWQWLPAIAFVIYGALELAALAADAEPGVGRSLTLTFAAVVHFAFNFVAPFVTLILCVLFLRAGRLHCTSEEKRRTDWIYAAMAVVVSVLLVVPLMAALRIPLKGLVAAFDYHWFLGIGSVLATFALAWFFQRQGRGQRGVVIFAAILGYVALTVLARRAGRLPIDEFLGDLQWLLLAVGPPVCLLVLLIGLGFSVFFRGAFDPGLVVKKTLLFSFVAVLMGTVIVAFEWIAVGALLRAVGPQAIHGTSTMLAGATIAVFLMPVRSQLQAAATRLTDRFMPATVIRDGARVELAVAFSDISSYTRLAAEDEASALHIAGLFHKAARSIAESTGGRIVKTIGDAVLWVFPDPDSSLRAATKLHEAFPDQCAEAGLPRLGIHSGVHFGFVVLDRGGDVYGATVNMAARLQSIAGDGEIVVSDTVQAKANNTAFAFAPLRERELKNIPSPVVCFRATAHRSKCESSALTE